MTFYAPYFRRWLGAKWDSLRYKWDDPVARWDERGSLNWYEDDHQTWYTRP